ncbi:SDR family NAD(P)-dependent oxidoreductase [Paractinoplanes brasiliensis]|uniref:3-oxoacyl-[acyl-carrier protein] reductase n=1 Tax=Paractinoplanes brasiliensis TaxID=52695 RepID=A0A4R6JQE1_9ACTN|nr:SDR family NAD(P)-dependent oxidoreductase [Actinoplanes brasiliensis]TDO36835.1 3-oxoacyl-[acyl-carrier protein] reductase [Actinoplanes brasiliensis]GID30352.1 beta-ketoacyl-ACP reductase [Actinoplanes brasiliensis]
MSAVALVAGGTGPIGRAVASALAGEGFRVAVHCRSRPDVAEKVVAGLDGDHVAVRADLNNLDEMSELLRRIGRVAVLVNAAHPALRNPAPVAGTTPADLTAQLAGVQAHAALCAQVVPGMRDQGWGRIVYVSGALMSRPAPGLGAYGAAKAAATVLTRYLALEEGRHGITANVVAPGRVTDPDEDEELTPEQAVLSARLLERMALPTFPTPAQVAAAVLTLVRSEALTGQTLWVTGGEPIGG